MSSPPESYDPRRFRTTVPYYARYRLGYPAALISRVIEMVSLKPGDAVLDLGCGPGTLAIPFAQREMQVTAVDPEPDMIAAAETAARDAQVALDLRQGSSFHMPANIGPFKLVTMGRSFHWMDREATVKILDRLVLAGGAIAYFDDEHVQTSENAWRTVLRELGNKYGRESSPHLVEAMRPDYRNHISVFLDSPFCCLERYGVFVRRTVTTDEISGYAFSLSTTSPEKLGSRAAEFEGELRTALAGLSPNDRFTEIAEMSAVIARRG